MIISDKAPGGFFPRPFSDQWGFMHQVAVGRFDYLSLERCSGTILMCQYLHICIYLVR